MDLYGWKKLGLAFEPVGSRVTCNPPPTDTDEDWLVYDPEYKCKAYLVNNDWDDCGECYDEDDEVTKDMSVYRCDYVNVICMHSKDQFDRFLIATGLAKRFNLMDKDDRIALFEAVRYGREYNRYTIDLDI
jgi:hypothetical protein